MSGCAHKNKIIIGECGERTLYWCPQCGGLASWGKAIEDIRWRLPELAVGQARYMMRPIDKKAEP